MNPGQSVVAIVDDDPLLLESLGDLLASAGHAVRTYTAGSLLLEDDALCTVDCLITDIGMPVMDGVELQQLANARRPELPVIFITGRRELATQRRIGDAAGTRVFQKPIDGKVLLAAVFEALSSRA